MQLNLKINGKSHQYDVNPNMTLLQLIRNEIGLTGTKEGCGSGECGACTVILDGKPVRSCIILAVEADECEIETIESLSEGGELHPIQEAFLEEDAVQCGFCTPGMVMATKALYNQKPEPTDEDVMNALSGHLCRCTGYKHIVDAVKLSSIKLK